MPPDFAALSGGATYSQRLGDEAVPHRPRLSDEGKAGKLSKAERDDMAKLLLSVPYPPAQRRSYTNELSEGAVKGFERFHIDGDLDGKARPNVCGNCHRMPFWVSTNTPGTGMDAPTWRGAYDRFLILAQGRLNIIDFDFYRRVADQGIPEDKVWQFSWGGRRRFDPVWNMVLEGSTGWSGSFARQVTLSKPTVGQAVTNDLLEALELSAGEGAVVLDGDGVFVKDARGEPASFQFHAEVQGGVYVRKGGDGKAFTRKQLVSLASKGEFIGTFTARRGGKDEYDHPQPALWTLGAIEKQSGRQKFPMLYPGQRTMTISARHIDDDANVLVDGRRVFGIVSKGEDEKLMVKLSALPPAGMHLLQIQNEDGLFSNDFIFHVMESEEAAKAWKRENDLEHRDMRVAMMDASEKGELDEMRRLFSRGGSRHDRHPRSGTAPSGQAAFHGQIEAAKLLIRRGVRVNHANRDGNSPLHTAAFLGRVDFVELLLIARASVDQENRKGETPIDVVSSEWSDGLAKFYERLNRGLEEKLDLEKMEQTHAKMAQLLREHREKSRKPKEKNVGKGEVKEL